ncbi:GntR family transcriptional regulator [Massilia sp. CT11-108]|jgi:DNA-binding GntR family transcriptional regulator|uniref:GntR family transcriptional regulator n=1 Tax=Massilia sp. CT11-108 TaxID=3393900 RepID=UPI0039A6B1E8
MNQAPPNPVTEAESGLSASRRVYLCLRRRIVEMDMLPGTRVVERDIAEEFGTSRTPVHEAVQRLADEGLIEIVPRSGTFVSRIPLDALDEANLVRHALETAIIEKAAERVGPDDMARLRAILAEQEAAITANDFGTFHRTDERFHALLAELSGYPGVWPIIQQAKTQMDRYRQLTLPLEGRMAGVLEEHRSVVDAIEARDPARAVAAMREHLDHVMPVLEITRKLRPEFFTAHLDARPPR